MAMNDICSNRHQRGWDFVSPLLGKSRQSSRNFFTLSVLNEAWFRITSTSPTQQKVDALSLAVNLPFISMMRMALAFAGLDHIIGWSFTVSPLTWGFFFFYFYVIDLKYITPWHNYWFVIVAKSGQPNFCLEERKTIIAGLTQILNMERKWK